MIRREQIPAGQNLFVYADGKSIKAKWTSDEDGDRMVFSTDIRIEAVTVAGLASPALAIEYWADTQGAE